MRTPWACSPEVRRALARDWPVVALESTLVAHGLPAPERFDVACEFESIVREAGAYPATIAVIDGEVRIGLNPDEIDRIAASTADHPLALSDLWSTTAPPRTAATTAAATAVLAARAGIRVLAAAGRRPRRTKLPYGQSAPALAEPTLAELVGRAGPRDLVVTRPGPSTGGLAGHLAAVRENVRFAAQIALARAEFSAGWVA